MPNLPAHMHRKGVPQVKVWVRMNLGARRENWTGPASSTFRGWPVVMCVDAPGDVTALCRYMLFRTRGALDGLAETDLRV